MLVAYTILTYTENMRILITLVIGISIGYMYTRVNHSGKNSEKRIKTKFHKKRKVIKIKKKK